MKKLTLCKWTLPVCLILLVGTTKTFAQPICGVDFLDFHLSINSNHTVHLYWTGTNEGSIFQDYELERTYGTPRYSFSKIYKVHKGTPPTNNYSFDDLYPCYDNVSGGTVGPIYYRLKLISDNDICYSPVLFITGTGFTCPSGNPTGCSSYVSFIEGDASICSGSKLYEMNYGVDAITWSISPSSAASISTNGYQVTVTNIGHGDATLTGTMGSCVITKSITVGAPTASSPFVLAPTDGCLPQRGSVLYSAYSDMSDVAYFIWGYTEGGSNPPVNYVNMSGSNQQYITIPNDLAENGIYVQAVGSACGAGYASDAIFEYSDGCGPGNGNSAFKGTKKGQVSGESGSNVSKFSLQGNPVRGLLRVTVPVAQLNKSELVIVDLNGRIIRKVVPVSSIQSIQVGDLKNGLYFIKLRSSSGSQTLKFIKS